MVEEHVGKKRRKEVRQAITMSEEMRRSLIFMGCAVAIGCLLVIIMAFVSHLELLPVDRSILDAAPLVIVAVILILVAPRASKYWELRAQYKDHVLRYNISKDDMRSLKDGRA